MGYCANKSTVGRRFCGSQKLKTNIPDSVCHRFRTAVRGQPVHAMQQHCKAPDQYIANVPFLKFGKDGQEIRRRYLGEFIRPGPFQVRSNGRKNALLQ
jgi:hypothetical protein